MFKVGQKVMIDNEPEFVGYIVKIEYDPLDVDEAKIIEYGLTYYILTYYIRVFKPFYKDGYFDFCRSENELTAV